MDLMTLLAPLGQIRGWLKFLGILNIISGVFICFSIIGILIAWLPIWLGWLLFASARRLDEFEASEQEELALESLKKIALYFKISGIATTVGIVLAVLALLTVPWQDADLDEVGLNGPDEPEIYRLR